jgi:hypothetical protein
MAVVSTGNAETAVVRIMDALTVAMADPDMAPGLQLACEEAYAQLMWALQDLARLRDAGKAAA